MHYVLPLLAHSARASSRTGDVFQVPPTVGKAIFHLYVSGGGTGGTTPTLDCRVQGAVKNESAYFTALRTWRSGTAPNSLQGLMTFTQTNTVGTEQRWADFIPPYVRAIGTIAGSSRGFTYSIDMACIED